MRSSFLRRTVGIACITTFFQLGVQAQNPSIPQAQSLQPIAPSGSASPTSETPDINKPGKPGNIPAPAVSDQAFDKVSGKTYAMLVFPVLRPKPAPTSERTSDIVANRAAGEIGAEIATRSWAIPARATRSRVVGGAGAESVMRAAIAEPKIPLKNPALRFRINPSEAKLSGNSFARPSMELLGPPASFQATAYALRGRTASGIYVRRGVIAADPRVIPLGSVVQIVTPGYSGVYTVQDTGRLIKGKIIDLWMGSSHEARIFGRRQIKLHILRWGKERRSQR